MKRPQHTLDVGNNNVLDWCFAKDADPRVLPSWPEADDLYLVCAYLVGGVVVAEVITSADHLAGTARGFPLGRLYFQIPKSAVELVCPTLRPKE